MKTTLCSFLLSSLLFLGCNETPIPPIESDSQSYQLIKIPLAGLTGGINFSATKTINGDNGGEIKINESYVTEDGDTVNIDVKLKVKKDCYSGNVDITVTVDDVYTAVMLTPQMVFNKPVELDLKYTGLDPEEMNLTSGNYDFLYIDDNGNTETIPSYGVVVNELIGEISVKKAKLDHFSRYSFTR